MHIANDPVTNGHRLTALRCLMLAAMSLGASEGRAVTYEQSMRCLPAGTVPPPASAYHPTSASLLEDADGVSRYVTMAFKWATAPSFLSGNRLGMEFKSYNYNYIDAAATSKGPAYVKGPGGYSFSDLPAWYVDSDFLSAKNVLDEYNEPQVGIGIPPGATGSIQANRLYVAWSRAVAGRGDRALLKYRHVPTGLKMPGIGISGYFLCEDVPGRTLIQFADGVYAPNCVVRDTATNASRSCVPPPPPPPPPPQPPAPPPPPPPPPAPPPAPSCAAGVTRDGGAEGLDIVNDFGAVSGTLQIQLETYGVPDALVLIQEKDGKRTLDTGYVSGYRTLSVPYNAAGGRLRVIIDPNRQFPTAWSVRMSCPGGSVASPIVRRTVSFYTKGNTCGATWKVNVDGAGMVGITQAIGASAGAQHSMQAQWTMPAGQTCGGVRPGSPGTLYVNDGRGEVALVNGFGGSLFTYFDVRP